jgi:integrase
VASIERTSNGGWRARYRDPGGRSRSRTFVTKVDARRFLDAAGADMARGRWIDPTSGRMRLEDWARTFLLTAHDLDEHTRVTYKRDLDRYVLPRFGALPLASIKPVEIRVWLAEELAAGLAPSSVHRHYRTLRRLLNVAVEHELLAKSPCAAVKPPAVPATEMRFLNGPEVHRLAEAITPRLRTLVYAAAYSGLRWGELIGLRRANVDVERRVIVVVEQLVHLNGRWVRKAPKTKAGRRSVGIPLFLAELLAQQLDEHPGAGPDDLVFPNQAGNPLHQSSFNTNYWKPAKANAGIEGLRWHDLRHTAVALAIAQGAHPKAIQARMGHSSVQVTLDRYGHLFPELDERIAEGLDDVYRAALTVIEGGRRDTRMTQMTRARHENAVIGGDQRSATDTKKARKPGISLEAARGIEPLYRALQALA